MCINVAKILVGTLSWDTKEKMLRKIQNGEELVSSIKSVGKNQALNFVNHGLRKRILK